MAQNDYRDEIPAAGARFVDELVIHCSASPNGSSLFAGTVGEPGFRTPAEAIDGWHAKRGFHRAEPWRVRFNPRLASIGYHFVVYTNGGVATGRHMDEIGAHVAGNNRTSIGICMIGTDRFALPQWGALRDLVGELRKKYSGVERFRVLGHRDLSPDRNNDGLVEPWEWLKTCPGFDVRAWLDAEMRPAPGHVFEPAQAATRQAA